MAILGHFGPFGAREFRILSSLGSYIGVMVLKRMLRMPTNQIRHQNWKTEEKFFSKFVHISLGKARFTLASSGPIGVEKSLFSKYLKNVGESKEMTGDLKWAPWDPLSGGMCGFGQLHVLPEIWPIFGHFWPISGPALQNCHLHGQNRKMTISWATRGVVGRTGCPFQGFRGGFEGVRTVLTLGCPLLAHFWGSVGSTGVCGGTDGAGWGGPGWKIFFAQKHFLWCFKLKKSVFERKKFCDPDPDPPTPPTPPRDPETAKWGPQTIKWPYLGLRGELRAGQGVQSRVLGGVLSVWERFWPLGAPFWPIFGGRSLFSAQKWPQKWKFFKKYFGTTFHVFHVFASF